ncbi:MAG TPA: hypothetical protein VFG59_16560 [Anaeromyxobacter sp.]|nr:hypothetical protein [Anaeromyxobacter sp.]
MDELRDKARELLQAGTVKVVIGHAAPSAGRRRPVFVRTPADAARLVHDEGCWHNLATYLTRPQVRRLGKPAIVASPQVLRAMLQLGAERQLAEDEAVALAVGNASSIRVLPTLSAVEEHLATVPDELGAAERAELERLSALPPAERRAFWEEQLGRCLKCYACRASCPMCYCERCTMDCNRPQWVPVASHALGNLEYHLVRAMHLAGRCVQCGTCGKACPVGIPVHLLTLFAEGTVRRHFGQRGGASARPEYALSTFRPDDKETFIR